MANDYFLGNLRKKSSVSSFLHCTVLYYCVKRMAEGAPDLPDAISSSAMLGYISQRLLYLHIVRIILAQSRHWFGCPSPPALGCAHSCFNASLSFPFVFLAIVCLCSLRRTGTQFVGARGSSSLVGEEICSRRPYSGRYGTSSRTSRKRTSRALSQSSTR